MDRSFAARGYALLLMVGCTPAEPAMQTDGSSSVGTTTTAVEPTTAIGTTSDLPTTATTGPGTGGTTGTTDPVDTGTTALMASTGTSDETDTDGSCVDCDGECVLRTAAEPDANPAWALICGTGLDEWHPAVTALGDDDMVVAFEFGRQVEEPGPVKLTLGETFTHEGGGDLILARLTSAGALVWSRSWGGPGAVWLGGVTATPGGRIVVAATFRGSIVIDGQAIGCDTCDGGLVVALEGDGSLAWHRVLLVSKPVPPDFPPDWQANRIRVMAPTIGPDGAVAIAGHHGFTVDFGQGPVPASINTNGFIVVYEPDGALRFVNHNQSASSVGFYSIAANVQGSWAVTGEFSGKFFSLGDGANVQTMLPMGHPFIGVLTAQNKASWASLWKGKGVLDNDGNFALGGDGHVQLLSTTGEVVWATAVDKACEGGSIGFLAPDRFVRVMHTAEQPSLTCAGAVDEAGKLLWKQVFAVPGSTSEAYAPGGAVLLAGYQDAPFDLLGPAQPSGGYDVWISRVTPPP